MLQFENHIPSTAALVCSASLSTSRRQCSAGTRAESVRRDVAFRRVRVEDKLVINGKADVNQLVRSSTSGPGTNICPAAPTTGCPGNTEPGHRTWKDRTA